MILGVAFVWFTTHFGGGFASGAQIYSYYVRYGIWCLCSIIQCFCLLPAFCENMRCTITGPTITRLWKILTSLFQPV